MFNRLPHYLIAIVIAFKLLCLNESQARQASNALSGFVLESDSGQALPAARVKLLPSGQITDSDVHGKFRFDHVKQGIYTLRATFVGYDSVDIDSIIIPWEGSPLVVFLKDHPPCKDFETRALNDLAHGNVYLLEAGLIAVPPDWDSAKVAQVESKYGFKSISIGCSGLCAEEYNRFVLLYLNHRNGPGWQKQCNREIDQLFHHR